MTDHRCHSKSIKLCLDAQLKDGISSCFYKGEWQSWRLHRQPGTTSNIWTTSSKWAALFMAHHDITLRQIKSVELVVTDGRRRESLMTKRVNRSEKSLRESHIRKYGRLYTVITWKTSHPIPRVSLDEQWKEDNRSEQPLYGLWTWRRWTGQAGPKQTKQLLNKTSSCFVQQLLGLNPLWSCRGQTQEQSSPNINVSFLYSNKAQCWRLCVFIMNTCVCSSDCVSVIQCLAVTYRLCVVRCNHVSRV